MGKSSNEKPLGGEVLWTAFRACFDAAKSRRSRGYNGVGRVDNCAADGPRNL
ncbi:MAG: hypothetical protein WDO18_03210 [Acidobacteriota bacterium]